MPYSTLSHHSMQLHEAMRSKKACDRLVSTIAESVLCPAPSFRSCSEAYPLRNQVPMLHAGMRPASIRCRFPCHRGWTTPATPVRALAERTTFDKAFECLSISIGAQSAKKAYFETHSESCADCMYFYVFLSFRWLI